MTSRRRSNFGSAAIDSNSATPATKKAAELLLANSNDKFDSIVDDFAVDDTQEDLELKALERRLNTEVEEDLFEEPRKFK